MRAPGHSVRALLALGLSLLFHASAFAQASVAITGRVTDSTGAPLPGVTVEATRDGAAAAVAVTAIDGSYAIHVRPGTYAVAFRLLNFATQVKKGISLAEGRGARVDTTLYLEASADIVVTAKQTFRNLADMDQPVNDMIGVENAASVGVATARQIENRPAQRPADVFETVPGVVISQHSGEGKANQYYLRGFNLDHGTDISIGIAGVPVNFPTHAHGQGWADGNFLIPELVSGVQYKKGPYYAEEGDFSTAGAVNVNYVNLLDRPMISIKSGEFEYQRLLVAASPKIGDGFLLYALEASHNDGPWQNPDDYRKWNGVLRYTRGGQTSGFSITAMGYRADWNATDQIPRRAVSAGLISQYGAIDTTDGAETHRYSLSSDWQRSSSASLTKVQAYAIDYALNIFSNFTYFLDDPLNGDQFEQADDRRVFGGRAAHQWLWRAGAVATENTIGIQVRRDDIANVGLYHTRERQRLETIREDAVLQTSGALFAQSSIQWHSKLRTVLGVRADRYSFEVDGNNILNSGSAGSSLVSPKVSVVAGPFSSTEFYLNFGGGFHSNDGRGATLTIDPKSGDPADRVDPLVRTKGAEIGFRSTAIPRVHTSLTLWGLDIDSELLFLGDAGTTEASRPSRRVGFEWNNYYTIMPWLTFDADVAYSRGRFRDTDPAGDRIPGAIEGVASAGLSFYDRNGWSGSVRYRFFGPRPLIEDNSVRSRASQTVNANVAYRLTDNIRLTLDVFNLFGANVSDIDYFYISRLPGEPAEGVEDIHTHPIEPRSFRFGISTTF